MISLIKYQLATFGHSQRFLPPVLLFLGLLSLLYSDNTGPVLPCFAVTAGAVMVFTGWITIALVEAEDPTQRMITACHSGTARRVIISIALSALMLGVGLSTVALLWGVLSNSATTGFTVTDIMVGVHAHLMCAAAGVAFALPCSRLLTHGLGTTVISSALVFGVVLLMTGGPPGIHQLLAAMSSQNITTRAVVRVSVFVTAAVIASPLIVANRWGRRD